MIAPTIIIGLGGIGSDICCRVSKQVKNEEQRRRIRFVCIDTDINDLNQRKAEDPRIITIQTSAPYMVSNYLETNTNAKDKWFPVHNILMGKTPTEGAGQVRAISRLAFEEAVRQGRMGALEKAIEELYFLDGAAAPQAVRVIIVSTLAGGTGSGIVLPLALYVRHFLETRFRKSASVVRGFFLLPEIMFGNKSPEECGSLCCNAYASLRELDAFMRKGDGALDGPKYKDLALELPDPSTGNYVSYAVSPFNFCFLYDKRNTDDLQLKSFDDYKEHAANTIYTQAISGISNRSNSNEDNAIKPLIKSNGRNRFCGAGSSLLKYPRDSVLQYIAGKWCIQTMDEEWLKIDNAYLQYLSNQKTLKKKNPGIKDQSLSEFYIEKIDSAEDNSFEKQIRDMCYNKFEDDYGNIEETKKLDDYTSKLEEHIRDMINDDPDVDAIGKAFQNALAKAEKAVGGKTKEEKKAEGKKDEVKGDDAIKRVFQGVVGLGQSYVNAAKAAGNRIGRTLAMQLFQEEKDFTDDDKDYRMEYYMHDEEGKFIHPNACRYFIYQLTNIFNEAYEAIPDYLKAQQDLINAFDDPNTDAIEDGFHYIDKSIGKKKFFIIPADKQQRHELIGNLAQQHEAALNYAIVLAQQAVYKAGLTYLKSLSAAYETFYNNFGSYVKRTKDEVAEIEHKYINGEGKATRYVCSSEKCLKGMLEQMPCSGESSSVNGPLSSTIFHEMKKYAMMVRKPNASMYFDDLYSTKILDFWTKRVENTYAAQIDMDILSALEAECEYESDTSMTQQQKESYCAEILRQAQRLAQPFIEDTMGEIRHPFTICAYNRDILGEPDSSRRSFVRANINDAMGGQVDENVSPYELMIYKAVYNLSAGDLKRFRAPEGSDRQGGTYYAAYIDTITQLGPNVNKNPVLTPHLDIKWHLPKFMPDLDDRNQKILEDNIYTALAWGMLTGKIDQTVRRSEMNEKGHIIYRPKSKRGQEFVISNGTPCDELYEVVDALAINPPQVQALLADRKKTIAREKIDSPAFMENKLITCLNWYDKKEAFGSQYEEELDEAEGEAAKFCIKQYTPTQHSSIFDFIYWIKASTPVDEYSEEELEIILESMIKMIEDYVKEFIDTDIHERCYKLFVDQFKLFLKNLADPTIKRPKNRLYDPSVAMIRDFMDERFENEYKVDSMHIDTMYKLYKEAINEE